MTARVAVGVLLALAAVAPLAARADCIATAPDMIAALERPAAWYNLSNALFPNYRPAALLVDFDVVMNGVVHAWTWSSSCLFTSGLSVEALPLLSLWTIDPMSRYSTAVVAPGDFCPGLSAAQQDDIIVNGLSMAEPIAIRYSAPDPRGSGVQCVVPRGTAARSEQLGTLIALSLVLACLSATMFVYFYGGRSRFFNSSPAAPKLGEAVIAVVVLVLGTLDIVAVVVLSHRKDFIAALVIELVLLLTLGISFCRRRHHLHASLGRVAAPHKGVSALLIVVVPVSVFIFVVLLGWVLIGAIIQPTQSLPLLAGYLGGVFVSIRAINFFYKEALLVAPRLHELLPLYRPNRGDALDSRTADGDDDDGDDGRDGTRAAGAGAGTGAGSSASATGDSAHAASHLASSAAHDADARDPSSSAEFKEFVSGDGVSLNGAATSGIAPQAPRTTKLSGCMWTIIAIKSAVVVALYVVVVMLVVLATRYFVRQDAPGLSILQTLLVAALVTGAGGFALWRRKRHPEFSGSITHDASARQRIRIRQVA